MALPLSNRISQVVQAGQTFTIAVPWQVFANTGNGPAATGTALYSMTMPAAGSTTGTAVQRYAELLDTLDRLVRAGLATVS
jgi:hypothetical protein